MGIIIGIDVGISTTKIVGLKNGRLFRLFAFQPQTLLPHFTEHLANTCTTTVLT